MDCDARQLVVDQLALACVKPDSHFEVEVAHRLDHGAGTAERARGPVKAGEEPVSGGIEFAATKAD